LIAHNVNNFHQACRTAWLRRDNVLAIFTAAMPRAALGVTAGARCEHSGQKDSGEGIASSHSLPKAIFGKIGL
jgi:hypothetical protein